MYKKGSRVCLKSNISHKGKIDYIHDPIGGTQFYEIRWDGGSVGSVEENELQSEVDFHSAWDHLSNNSLLSHNEYSNANIFYKVRNTTNNTVSSLRASRTLFKPYQFKPLIKFLNSDIKRLLIADEVGLGKTIEAGHILLELMGRGKLHNALIVCTKPIQEKWRNELRTKFNLDFKTYETTKDLINDIKRDINNLSRTVKGIITYEKAKNPNFLSLIEENSYSFDLMVCDEAHKLKNHATGRYSAFEKLVPLSDAVVFMTATPITLGIRDLFNQLRLLEPERYAQFGVLTEDFNVFQNDIELNKPFINALRSIQNKEELKVIYQNLIAASVVQTFVVDDSVVSEDVLQIAEEFSDDPLFQRAIENLQSGEDNPKIRALIAHDLSQLNSLNHLYTRVRKREVLTEEERIHRHTVTISVKLNDNERIRYDSVMNLYGSLAAVTKKRQASSSIIGYETPREELILGNFDLESPDSKFDRLYQEVLFKVVKEKGKKLIIFSTFINTLIYLEAKLKHLGFTTEIIHGLIKEKDERIDNFRDNNTIQILLSSEVGSEGLDFQYCDTLVNYDLPWNPMVVEQRIGRIDRVGQKNKVINIFSMVIKKTIEEEIFNRLLIRINIFKESIGDLESILSDDEGLYRDLVSLENDLYQTELTRAQQIARIDQVALAIENEKINLGQIKKELTDSISNDIHFEHIFNDIEKNQRYLTEKELRSYVKSLFNTVLPRLKLVHQEGELYQIEVPNKNTELFNFIDENLGAIKTNTELHYIFRQFKTRYFNSRKIPITFSQEYAFDKPPTEFVNSYHPIIIAYSNYLESKGNIRNQAFKIGLLSSMINDERDIEPGVYLMIVFKINVLKIGIGKEELQEQLHAVIADFNQSELSLLEQDDANYLMGVANINAKEAQPNFDFNEGVTNSVRTPVTKRILQIQKGIHQEEEFRLQSSRQKRLKMETYFFDNQIKRRESQLSEGKGLKQVLESQLEELERKKKERITALARAAIECSHDIISVNYLEVKTQ